MSEFFVKRAFYNAKRQSQIHVSRSTRTPWRRNLTQRQRYTGVTESAAIFKSNKQGCGLDYTDPSLVPVEKRDRFRENGAIGPLIPTFRGLIKASPFPRARNWSWQYHVTRSRRFPQNCDTSPRRRRSFRISAARNCG